MLSDFLYFIDSYSFTCDFAVGHPTVEGSSDTFWEDLSKIVALDQQDWGSFDHKRIRRQRKRTARCKFLAPLCRLINVAPSIGGGRSPLALSA